MAGGEHGIRLDEVERQRFFAEDVHAALSGGNRQFGVLGGLGGDDHEVGSRLVEQAAVVEIAPSGREIDLVAGARQVGREHIGDADQLDLR